MIGSGLALQFSSHAESGRGDDERGQQADQQVCQDRLD